MNSLDSLPSIVAVVGRRDRQRHVDGRGSRRQLLQLFPRLLVAALSNRRLALSAPSGDRTRLFGRARLCFAAHSYQ